jgi:hypothetical protein
MNRIESIPEFEKLTHYKEYDPYEGGYRYRYVTLKEIEFRVLYPLIPRGQKIIFKDKKGGVWMTMTPYKITISKDYAWDGCTPKRWWGIWWGTPDFESTILASLLHDVLLQFYTTKHFPLSRYEIDNFFKYILEEHDFILSKIYYYGVRSWSTISPAEDYNVKSELTTIPKD